MRMERHGSPSTRKVHEERSSSSYYGCEHSATSSYLQRTINDLFMTKKMEKGDVPKKGILGDYLQEYEAQSKGFKYHLKLQGFCKIKEEIITRSKQHGVGIFFLSTFYGSPKCPARAWVKELDNYVQQHQVSENEAIKVAVLHLEGKAYSWWLFEYFSLKNENTSTYAKFIRRIVERFDEKSYETPSIESIKPYQTKILHGLARSINSAPFQKTIEGEGNLYDTFPKAKSPLHEDISSQEEDMEIPPSKEDQYLRSLIDDEAF